MRAAIAKSLWHLSTWLFQLAAAIDPRVIAIIQAKALRRFEDNR